MRAGLAASTVTPGKIAPDVSLTVPAITACAAATPGTRRTHASRITDFAAAFIAHLAFYPIAVELLGIVPSPRADGSCPG